MTSPSRDRTASISSMSIHRALAVGVLVLAVQATACRDPEVVARVGHTDLRNEDLQDFTSRRASGAGEMSAQLDALIARVRLAEHATGLGLPARPDIRARLAAAQREVLAQAALEEALRGATDETALRERYAVTRDTLARRQVQVRHILVRLSPGADDAERRRARDRASLLHARITGGESFEAVARDASQDEASSQHGGSLGIVREGQVHPSFFEAVAALGKDELSKPFETPFGVHVAQALAPVESVVPSFDEIRGVLAAQARREAEARLSKELEERIKVTRFPEAMGSQGKPAPDAAVKRGDEG
ncbi:hypothetical protein FJV41_11780 [Myxococcus llanfairpwllgwyngyllgogerychwyrndrobwllllantysiliogogogochensis]|uniref:PpiC domain-containing protein n=2 Tax=Myxococcus llanfairpwllgwyngyllgogerychwyrndrobwllllantysiliogogogochensis TaxID=2590453 RepID=A0A540X3A6_9BACT|nr:hypothetical protein FJV41_11780 [Myxococcus llanfairpwllgwyngyllgogerychwyrndrobwllllantysiliogogogochensis]